MTEAFPLAWPDGWPRTDAYDRRWSLPGGRGNTPSWNKVIHRLTDNLRMLGAGNVVVSTNQPLRLDGLPYAATRKIDDPGAATYFTLNDRQLAMAQDRYELLLDNLRSLALAIEGLRQMERHGGGHMMERAFAGFAALPPPGASKPWRDVLGDCQSLPEARAKRNQLAKNHHADTGAEGSVMVEINIAFNQARKELA